MMNRDKQTDLGLAVLSAIQKPGECLRAQVIAEATGKSTDWVFYTEQRALMKLSNHILFGPLSAIMRELK